nr:2-amino-4-oxopentanoate thiolase subunit OrtA [Tissierella sp.]
MQAKSGDWVRIYSIVLDKRERAENIPLDTKEFPLEMWSKGFLEDNEANIGDFVEIETYIGRKTKGILVEINPYFKHTYGKTVPQILYIGRQARNLLDGGEIDG